MIKLLTCQTWITEFAWFNYAMCHRQNVPCLLVDRSPCLDPFLDPYASPQERRPLISGLCRILKHFQLGDIYIYLTKVDPSICRVLGIQMGSYLGIAALEVIKVHASHAVAATTFTPRRYVVAPVPTPYPPNLAHDPCMPGAALRESSIVSQKHTTAGRVKSEHFTPDHSTDRQWRNQIQFYHMRQKERKLHVAECRLCQVDGRNALQLDPAHAPVFTAEDWRGQRMNVQGIHLEPMQAEPFYHWIAYGR